MGRPIKPCALGEKVSLGLKVTAEIKNEIDRAAKESGRTQSQEAEHRLTLSFYTQGLLNDVLTLAYGGKIARELIEIGDRRKSEVK